MASVTETVETKPVKTGIALFFREDIRMDSLVAVTEIDVMASGFAS